MYTLRVCSEIISRQIYEKNYMDFFWLQIFSLSHHALAHTCTRTCTCTRTHTLTSTLSLSHFPGSAAEIISRQLYEKIHTELSSVPNLFTESAASSSIGAGSSFQRPVLLILDRNLDLSVMLTHCWSYQALCHDVFDLNLNRVKMPVKVFFLKFRHFPRFLINFRRFLYFFGLEFGFVRDLDIVGRIRCFVMMSLI